MAIHCSEGGVDKSWQPNHLSHVATNTVLKWLLNKRNPEGEQDLTTGRCLPSYSGPYGHMIGTSAVFFNVMLCR